MSLEIYKKGQGTIVRLVGVISLYLLIAYGCYALYHFISPVDPSVQPPRATFWGTNIFVIPFFDAALKYGMLISALLFILFCFLAYILILNKPKSCDYLIETEGELRKVSWPTREQYIGSSIAVIVSVVIMGIFLLGADFVFEKLIRSVIRLY
jgi:preprotein translocase SecE subunit